MAFEQVIEGLEYAQNAGADLSAKLYYLCKIDTDGDIILAAAGTDHVFGVIREGNTADKPVTVQFGGIGKVIAGGTIVAGDRLTADANGKAVATTTAGNKVIGVALMSASANEIFSFAFQPGHVAVS